MRVFTPVHFFVLSLSVLLLNSCASYKKFDYVPIQSVKSLEGIYYNNKHAISGGMNIGKYQYSEKKRFSETDIFKIEFPDSKTLNLLYLDNNEWQFLKSYKGKYNRKKNTFDIWHSRRIYPFIIMWGYDFDKVRIGKDNEDNLIVNNAHNNLGLIIPLGAGGNTYSYIKKVFPVSELPPLPVFSDGKWGYKAMTGKTIIECRYDTVTLFEGDIARVRLNGKWGLINRKGTELCPFKYKAINPISLSEQTLVYLEDEKVGVILRDGTETIPPIYEKIEYRFRNEEFGITFLLGHKGIITSRKILFPPVFDEVDLYTAEFAKPLQKKGVSVLAMVIIEKQKYALDTEGYLYPEEAKTNLHGASFTYNHSKKIHYTEVIKEK